MRIDPLQTCRLLGHDMHFLSSNLHWIFLEETGDLKEAFVYLRPIPHPQILVEGVVNTDEFRRSLLKILNLFIIS